MSTLDTNPSQYTSAHTSSDMLSSYSYNSGRSCGSGSNSSSTDGDSPPASPVVPDCSTAAMGQEFYSCTVKEQPEMASANVTDKYAGQYVKLDPEYTRYLTWSNDPCDLDLRTNFRPEPPNIANDFNVPGLKPVLREPGTDLFLLSDAEGLFYLWDMWEGCLLQVTEEWTKDPELHSIEDVVKDIVINSTFVEDDAIQIFRDR